MPIKKVKITNFKHFKDTFTIELDEGVNILVGKNGEGKSTILEAINLALTGFYHGRAVSRELSQYLFNTDAVKEYIAAIQSGDFAFSPPSISIELFYDSSNGNPEFEGNRNSERVNGICGFSFNISFNEKYRDSYTHFLHDKRESISTLPLEYYEVTWETFSRKIITPKDIKLSSSFVDSSRNTYRSISDVYIARIIKNSIEDEDRLILSQEYRELASRFAQTEAINSINQKLNRVEKPFISGEKVTLSVDIGSNASWENPLIALANDIPFSYIGKGSQCILKTELSLRSKEHENAGIVLIEEPECHLSHSNLQKLVSHIEQQSFGKQIIISTHSSYVTNRLGLRKVIMIANKKQSQLKALPEDTATFFKKLSGYDTLRYILCDRAFLVEGPCDALIIERAYKDKWGKYPADEGYDIIEVGTSFSRFLELAESLKIETAIVTDNDGKPEALNAKYAKYNNCSHITICYEPEAIMLPENLKGSLEENYNYNTLEPCLYRSNGASKLCEILEIPNESEAHLLKYMKRNKTDCALKISSSEASITYPNYIQRAISKK